MVVIHRMVVMVDVLVNHGFVVVPLLFFNNVVVFHGMIPRMVPWLVIGQSQSHSAHEQKAHHQSNENPG